MNKDEAVHGCGKNKNTVDCQDRKDRGCQHRKVQRV